MLTLLLWLQLDPQAKATVIQRLQSLQQFHVQFEQTTFSDFFDPVLAKGTLTIQRPGKLHMTYDEGEHKKIICDGQTFYEYDFDAEAESRLGQEEFVDEPLVRIFLYGDNIEDLFFIDQIQDEEGTWIQFKPKMSDDFDFLMMFNEQGQPKTLTVTQPDGEGTRFEFRKWNLKPNIPAGAFNIPAEGQNPR